MPFEPCPKDEQANARKHHAAQHALHGHGDAGVEAIKLYAALWGDILGNDPTQYPCAKALADCGD